MQDNTVQLQQKLLNQEQKDENIKQGSNTAIIIKQQKSKVNNSYDRANWFSKFTFLWAHALIKKGNKQCLEQDMLEDLSENQRTSYNFRILQTNWNYYSNHNYKLPLLRSLFTSFRSQFIVCFLFQFLSAIDTMALPLFINYLIKFVSNPDRDVKTGVIWIVVLFFYKFLEGFLDAHSSYWFNLLGYTLSSSMNMAIYNKSLHISLLSNKQCKTGQLVNYMQVDTQKLEIITNMLAQLMFLPIQLIVGLVIMYDLIGTAFLGGFIALVVVGYINYLIGKFSTKYHLNYMKAKDERLKRTNEIFNLIRFIKMNAWEEYFYDRLDRARNAELRQVAGNYRFGCASIMTLWIAPILIINSTFIWYVLMGEELTAQRAFTVISLFSVLQYPLRAVPEFITDIIDTKVSLGRLEKFLKTNEVDTSYIKQKKMNDIALSITNGNFNWGEGGYMEDDELFEEGESSGKKDKKDKSKDKEKKKLNLSDKKTKKSKNISKQEFSSNDNNNKANQVNANQQDVELQSQIQMSKQESSEIEEKLLNKDDNSQVELDIGNDNKNKKKDKQSKEKEEEEKKDNQSQQNLLILKNINLKFKKGYMTAIIGEVGSGKSSILYSIIGDMLLDQNSSKGQIDIDGSICFCPQKPWIQNLSIRDNILFGRQFVQEKYNDCLQYSCLQPDLEILQYGDQTMIGEKGINLSGGQKARIALARALYSEGQLMVLDDILSAVDAHVGKSIMEDCLLKYRKNSTRIIVTHAIGFLRYMDCIVIMENGQVAEEGSYEQVQQTDKFQKIYKQFAKNCQEEVKNNDNKKEDKDKKMPEEQLSEIQLQKKVSSKEELDKQLNEKKIESVDNSNTKEDKVIDKLIIEEDRIRGSIESKTYFNFIKINGGAKYILTIIVSMSLFEGCQVLSSIWLSIWTSNNDLSKNYFYLKWYIIISMNVGTFVFIRVATILITNYLMVKKLHSRMITGLLYAPLNKFFDRIPIGRILNRLSKDLTILDLYMGYSVGNNMVAIFQLLGSIILCAYASSFWIIAPILVMSIAFIKIQKYYITSQREIVRLESISKSPIVQFFTETLNGLSTIRAYNEQQRFAQQHLHNVDENRKATTAIVSCTNWLNVALSLLSLIINVTSVTFCLFAKNTSPSLTGLLLTYAFTFDSQLSSLIQNETAIEQRLVSFERCQYFTQIECEKGYNQFLQSRDQLKQKGLLTQTVSKHSDWPKYGMIIFRNVEAKYRENLNAVLKNINFSIKPKEKIGIVGRTGSGKSTITLTILRVIELFKGQIFIDGLDISLLSLEELRSKITIIMQDSQLFNGTIKENIDPLNQFSNEQIMEVIKQCNLENLVKQRDGLKMIIEENGENLSVGEKQLVCIARALLKKSKIILIDEATANIDLETEQIIQNAIKKVFQDCTVLTIAHRINTILQSDRIIVLKDGDVEEFDTPQVLLNQEKSLFKTLYNEGTKNFLQKTQ